MGSRNTPNAEREGLERLRAQLGEIYERLRTARLNFLYYSDRLAGATRVSRTLAIILALGATGSPILAWAIWQSPVGKVAWSVIAAAISIIAILKLTLQSEKKIKQLTEARREYSDVYYDLKELVDEIRQRQEVTEEMIERVASAKKRLRTLATGDEHPRRASIAKYEEMVHQEIPVQSLWNPTAPPAQVDGN